MLSLARRAAGSAALGAALVAAAFGAPGLGAPTLAGSIASDSLLMPTETWVLTRDDLIEKNIHTLDDILRLIPGVSFWREGPPGSTGGFSVDGRSSRGVNLLVNGSPAVDRYTMESLARFLPLSRVLRVEVLYSGSPHFTGSLSSNGAINIVLEEGGREGPAAEIDFTYGQTNQRARRAWFSTPKAHVTAVIAYDEYLQDARESYPAIPRRVLGDYDVRSVYGEISFRAETGENALVRLQRFEDTYVGTSYRSDEDIRRSGYRSEITFGKDGFSAFLAQQTLLRSRSAGALREHTVRGTARWAGGAGGLGIRVFAAGERSVFDNTLWGERFEPSCRLVEGGILMGGELPSNVTWRVGCSGGDHSVAGRYGSAELALARAWTERLSQDVILARRVRVPSAEELFQPTLERTMSGDAFATAGNPDLSPETSDELSIGVRYGSIACAVFGRDVRSLIRLAGSAAAVYRSDGSGRVAGARASYAASKTILGFECGLGLALDAFPERTGLAPGVPRYTARGEAGLKRRIFGGTELVSIKLNAEAAGERDWSGTALESYQVCDFSASLSIMSARISFEYRNFLDAKYETVPGFEMPRRHYLIGVFWELLD